MCYNRLGMEKEKRNNIVIDFLKGGALGTGILPGVSMGTVGIIVDIYDKFIDNISGLKNKATFKKSFLTLIPICLGLVIFTVLLMLFWDNFAYDYIPFFTICILAGFIIGGFPLMGREIMHEKVTFSGILRIFIPFLVAAGIGVAAFIMAYIFLADPEAETSFFIEMELAVFSPFDAPWIFVIMFAMGLVSAISSIVPGISGAMMMFITGLYSPIIALLIDKDQSVIFNFDSFWWPRVLELLILIVGMLIGFIVTSTVMKDMLVKHRVGTFQIVCGFVLGSIISMFLNNDMCFVYFNWEGFNWQMVVGPIAGIATIFLTYFLLKRSEAKKKAKLEELSLEQTEENPSSNIEE